MIYEIEIGTEKGKLSLITLGLEKEDVINSLQTDRFFIGYTHTGLTFGLNANEIVTFDIQKKKRFQACLQQLLQRNSAGKQLKSFLICLLYY
ncbi:hypothetical protein MGI18_16500 [Bacillus sp. OVS6]|nr:hypothetical protein MGI18_16500 [Bacillus sp. OVS6]